jgi:putative FmdB family regulatory protein
MPIYEFSCEQCGNHIEVLQKFKDKAPACKSCNKNMKKQFPSRTSFALKGDGWAFDSYGAKDVTYGQGGGGRGMKNINTATTALKDY